MLRRSLAGFVALALLAAGPAAAEEKADSNKQVGQYVDLQPVAMPVVIGGQLVNYIFVSVRLNLAPGVDTSRWRAKEPFFRDALVRSGYATPFALPNQNDKLDVPRLTASLMRSATAITGPGVIRSIVVTSQVPSRRTRAPRA